MCGDGIGRFVEDTRNVIDAGCGNRIEDVVDEGFAFDLEQGLRHRDAAVA
jgi:hypothetical protein